ncbi:MAG: hypothetical protein WAN46_20055 [Gammaproteobacteria bacterium]
MDPAHKAARTELARQVPLLVKKLLGTPEVAAKVQSRDQCRGQNFRITHPALRIFTVLERFQQIIAEALNDLPAKAGRLFWAWKAR